MSAGRVYWGQMLCVLAAFAASLVITTQWTADALGYQSQLGTPDLAVFGYPLSAAWKFFLWWYAYDAYARHIFETGALIFLSGVILSVGIAFGFSLWRAREAKDSATDGSARRATSRDVRKLNLATGDGVIQGTLGVTTETRAQMNYAGSRMAPWLGRTMVSRQEVPRPLLTPGEVIQLPHAGALILTGGAPLIRARKVRYFAEPLLKARLRPPFASPRHSPKGLPAACSGLVASSTALPERPQSTSSRRASGSGHTHAQDQSEQSLQQAFNFGAPAAGEPTQTNGSESQAARQTSDDLGAAFTGSGLARTLFAFDPDHFDTDV